MGKEKRPATPAEWRDLLKADYDYPEEINDVGRRKRRQARKAHRERERADIRQRIRQEREREPISAGGALVVIAAILLVGAIAGWAHWAHSGGRPAAAASPSAALPTDAPQPTGSAGSAAPSASGTDNLSDPDTVAQNFARAYESRNPPQDQDHNAPVRRAAAWATPALAENLSSSTDRAWNDLVSNGGVQTVSAVTVGPAAHGLPPDTPLRVWRTVTVQTHIKGYKTYDQTVTLQAELTRDGDQWLVSRLVGV